MTRPGLQLHLSTLFIISLLAAVLIGVNLADRRGPEAWHSVAHLYPAGCEIPKGYYKVTGWPFVYSALYDDEHRHNEYFHGSELLADICIFPILLAVAAFVIEWLTRRVKRKPTPSADDPNSLYLAVEAADYKRAKMLLLAGTDPNRLCLYPDICKKGGLPLFPAILSGDLDMVKLLLVNGADPNIHAGEPASEILAETPISTAKQLRFFLDHDKYDPIVRLLEQYSEKSKPPERGAP